MKFPFTLFILFFTFGVAHANQSTVATNQTVPQKVSIIIDESGACANEAYLLRKSILSFAQNSPNIYLFSSDPVELQYLRVESLNGFTIIDIETNDSDYLVRLSFSHGTDTNDSPEIISVPRNNLAVSFDFLGSRMFRTIAAEFPRKVAVEVREIVVERHTLSEFETVRPAWSFSLSPSYFYRKNTVSLDYYSGSTNTNYIKYLKETTAFALSLGINFQYRNWFAFITPSLVIPFRDNRFAFMTQAGFGIGILRSLIVLMPFVHYQYGRTILESGGWYTSETVNNTFGEPVITYWGISAGLRARLNISTKFYFQIDMCPVILGGNMNVSATGMTEPQIISLSHQSPPHVKLEFNFEITRKLNLLFYYSINMQQIRNDTEIEEDDEIFTIYNASSGDSAMFESMNINQSSMGIGLQYEI